MKIVIDIPEMAYEAYKEWHKNKVATVEQSLIATGKPYQDPLFKSVPTYRNYSDYHDAEQYTRGWNDAMRFIFGIKESDDHCQHNPNHIRKAVKKNEKAGM